MIGISGRFQGALAVVLTVLLAAGCEGDAEAPLLDEDRVPVVYQDLSVDEFGMALRETDPVVRQAAVDAVIGMPDRMLIERLEHLKYAMTDPDEAVRASVVTALRGSEDPRAIALLLQARQDASASVRAEALEALSELRTGGAGPDDESAYESSD